MSFHKSNFGAFGGGLPCDMNGYIPEATDTDPFAFAIDHGTRTHEEGDLTEYGEWWAEDGFQEWRDAAVEATAEAAAELAEWQADNA